MHDGDCVLISYTDLYHKRLDVGSNPTVGTGLFPASGEENYCLLRLPPSCIALLHVHVREKIRCAWAWAWACVCVCVCACACACMCVCVSVPQREEQQVASLEMKLAQLSETVGSYVLLRDQDQTAMQ